VAPAIHAPAMIAAASMGTAALVATTVAPGARAARATEPSSLLTLQARPLRSNGCLQCRQHRGCPTALCLPPVKIRNLNSVLNFVIHADRRWGARASSLYIRIMCMDVQKVIYMCICGMFAWINKDGLHAVLCVASICVPLQFLCTSPRIHLQGLFLYI
jgi:hypothetical protein